jgi:hypothetical protein
VFHPWPLVNIRFRPFSGYGRRVGIRHLWVCADIDALHVVAELDGDSVGVEGVDGMDKAVVDDVRNMEAAFSCQRSSSVSTPKET